MEYLHLLKVAFRHAARESRLLHALLLPELLAQVIHGLHEHHGLATRLSLQPRHNLRELLEPGADCLPTLALRLNVVLLLLV